MTAISVVGLGKLGVCMAASFAAKGHKVWGVDTDPQKVDLLNRGLPPLFEPGLADALSAGCRNLQATAETAEAVGNTSMTFIVVPTPSLPDGSFSLDYVNAAIRGIGRALRSKQDYHVVVLTSTVSPGSSDHAVVSLLEEESQKRCGQDFGFCYSPEFIALGSVLRDFLNPDFVLIGESDERAGRALEECLQSTLERMPRVAHMNLVNAELSKIAVNSYVTTKISFANMVAAVCNVLPGADVDTVTRAIGLDSRIGTKYLSGGMPFGGPCFPRDNRALSSLVRGLGLQPFLPEAVDAANLGHLDEIVSRVVAASKGGPVTVLGITYKPGSVVLDASPGLALAANFLSQGYEVRAYEPLLHDIRREELPAGLAATDSLDDALSGAETVVIATPDPLFRDGRVLDIVRRARVGVVFDCWRLLEGEPWDQTAVEYIPFGRTRP